MAPDPAVIAAGLSELAGCPVTVTGAASLGAQRSTLFIDLARPGGVESAVAQISTGAVETRPVTAEAALITAVGRHGVPVPTVHAATDELPGVGLPAMIVSREEGRTIPRHILRALPDCAAGDELARQCGTALAALHTIAPTEAPEAFEDVSAAQFVELQTQRLELLGRPQPAIRFGLRWLADNKPAPVPSTIVHGDLRNGNIVVDDDGLVAVLDWEVAQRSDPMQDLAWLCLRTWRFGSNNRQVGGFGDLDALVGGYEAAGGTFRQHAFDWWTAARCAWWAIGLAAQALAFTTGRTDAIMLAASGRRVPELEFDLLDQIRQIDP